MIRNVHCVPGKHALMYPVCCAAVESFTVVGQHREKIKSQLITLTVDDNKDGEDDHLLSSGVQTPSDDVIDVIISPVR